MQEFMLGCNYWASNAGTEMWKQWDASVIKEDFEILSQNGVKYVRIFPNWRDFQPIMPMLDAWGHIWEYRLEGERFPENPYFLDEDMMEHFAEICDMAEQYELKLIIGLLTGYMSGRVFIPSALYEKNLFTDSTALYFEQKLIQGIVSRFKDKPAIYAWDLGNECNSMSPLNNRMAAASWTATVSNTIRAYDNTRPVISGMHELRADDNTAVWTLKDQGEFNDILTTHPYPYWTEYAQFEEIGTFRTTMHATCQTKLYSGVGKKPCLVEETGTMGPMLCNNERSKEFMRCNLFSNWANGSLGYMWWCANEQTNLKTAPYTWNMVEVELGMIDADRKPKPILREMKRFSEFLKSLDFELPPAKRDAVCILTQSQPQWGVAYMTYCLSKQSGLNIDFTYCNQELPESDVYMLPSINKFQVMPGEQYNELKKRVYEGATLYISNQDGILSEFEELTGLKVLDSAIQPNDGYIELADEKIYFKRKARYKMISAGAEIIAYDQDGLPAISKYNYGKGTVWYVNFPLEEMLLEESNAFDDNYYKVYNKVFEKAKSTHGISTNNPYIALTEHPYEDVTYCIAVNHSSSSQKPKFVFKNNDICKVIYGSTKEIPPFDAVVFAIK